MDFENFPTFYNFFNLIMYYGPNAEILGPPERRNSSSEPKRCAVITIRAAESGSVLRTARRGRAEPGVYRRVLVRRARPRRLRKEAVYPLVIEDLTVIGQKRGRGLQKYPKVENKPKRPRSA